jgi:hypothetical protein
MQFRPIYRITLTCHLAPDNPRLSFLRKLLGTHPSVPVITSTDIFKQQDVDVFSDRQDESIQQHHLDYFSDDYETTTISDDDDTQVDESLILMKYIIRLMGGKSNSVFMIFSFFCQILGFVRSS